MATPHQSCVLPTEVHELSESWRADVGGLTIACSPCATSSSVRAPSSRSVRALAARRGWGTSWPRLGDGGEGAGQYAVEPGVGVGGAFGIGVVGVGVVVVGVVGVGVGVVVD